MSPDDGRRHGFAKATCSTRKGASASGEESTHLRNKQLTFWIVGQPETSVSAVVRMQLGGRVVWRNLSGNEPNRRANGEIKKGSVQYPSWVASHVTNLGISLVPNMPIMAWLGLLTILVNSQLFSPWNERNGTVHACQGRLCAMSQNLTHVVACLCRHCRR